MEALKTQKPICFSELAQRFVSTLKEKQYISIDGLMLRQESWKSQKHPKTHSRRMVSYKGFNVHHNWNHQIRSPCPEIRLRLWRYSRVQKRLLPYVAPLECDGAHLGTIVGKEWKLNMLGLKPPSKTHRNHRKISRWTRRYKKHHNQPSFYAVFPNMQRSKNFRTGLTRPVTKKTYVDGFSNVFSCRFMVFPCQESAAEAPKDQVRP